MSPQGPEAAPQLPPEAAEARQAREARLTPEVQQKLNAKLDELSSAEREVANQAIRDRQLLQRMVAEAAKMDKDRSGTLNSDEGIAVDRLVRRTVEAAANADTNKDGTIDAQERIQAGIAMNKVVAAGAVTGAMGTAQDLMDKLGGWAKTIGKWWKEMKAALGIEDDEEKAKREQEAARTQQQASERGREQNEQQRTNMNQAQDKLAGELGKLGANELKKLEKGGKLEAGTAADESITVADDGKVTLGAKAVEKLLGSAVAGDAQKRTEALQQLQAALLAKPAQDGGKTELTQRLEKRGKIESELKALPAGTALQLAADGKSISKVAQGQPAQPLSAADYGYADGSMFVEAVKAAGVQLQPAPAAAPATGPAAAAEAQRSSGPGGVVLNILAANSIEPQNIGEFSKLNIGYFKKTDYTNAAIAAAGSATWSMGGGMAASLYLRDKNILDDTTDGIAISGPDGKRAVLDKRTHERDLAKSMGLDVEAMRNEMKNPDTQLNWKYRMIEELYGRELPNETMARISVVSNKIIAEITKSNTAAMSISAYDRYSFRYENPKNGAARIILAGPNSNDKRPLSLDQQQQLAAAMGMNEDQLFTALSTADGEAKLHAMAVIQKYGLRQAPAAPAAQPAPVATAAAQPTP